MSKLNVLNIVPWFPNPTNNMEGIFIAEHIKALNKHCANTVLHFQFGKKNQYELDAIENIKIERYTLKPIIDKWYFKEKLVSKKIADYLAANSSKYNVVNFHITYPNAINITKIANQFPNVKFCMTEHWSAYHSQFNLPKKNKGRKRIEQIFANNIPLFVVSKALGEDIQNFIQNPDKKFEVIPNCINENTFFFKEKIKKTDFVFASINNWSVMKNPIVLLNAFAKLTVKHKNIKLVLGGDGALLNDMKELVKRLAIEESITILGRIPKGKVFDILSECNVYCQSSNYETFSVICIEALATGTPVIATNIGGMKDFVTAENGVLVNDLEVESWFLAMEQTYLNYAKFDRSAISKKCLTIYNCNSVGQLFYEKLKNLQNEK